VYFGGPGASFDTTPDGQFTPVPSTTPGRGLAGAGDVDGDGFGDLLVGMPGDDGGRVRIFLGGPGATFDTTPDAMLSGTNQFGSALSGAGDVNGDCYSDILVGTVSGGYVELYLGGPGALDTTADAAFTGGATFGKSVTSAGDVNADGFDDVAITERNADPYGAAYVYFGGPGVFDATADVTFGGEPGYYQFGNAIGSGDFDGDGVSDLVVSAHAIPSRAYVFHGGPGGAFDATADVVLQGASGWLLGDDLFVADLNADGIADCAVGGGLECSANGNVQIFTSPFAVGTSALASQILVGETSCSAFGLSVGGPSSPW